MHIIIVSSISQNAPNIILPMPELHYYDCQAVLEGLKSTEGDTKSLFGQYTSPRVRVSDGSGWSHDSHMIIKLSHRGTTQI